MEWDENPHTSLMEVSLLEHLKAFTILLVLQQEGSLCREDIWLGLMRADRTDESSSDGLRVAAVNPWDVQRSLFACGREGDC